MMLTSPTLPSSKHGPTFCSLVSPWDFSSCSRHLSTTSSILQTLEGKPRSQSSPSIQRKCFQPLQASFYSRLFPCWGKFKLQSGLLDEMHLREVEPHNNPILISVSICRSNVLCLNAKNYETGQGTLMNAWMCYCIARPWPWTARPNRQTDLTNKNKAVILSISYPLEPWFMHARTSKKESRK